MDEGMGEHGCGSFLSRTAKEYIMSVIELPPDSFRTLNSPLGMVLRDLQVCCEQFKFEFFYLQTWQGKNICVQVGYDRVRYCISYRVMWRTLKPIPEAVSGLRLQCIVPSSCMILADETLSAQGTCNLFVRREFDEPLRFRFLSLGCALF
jgi:hypothetical protein